MSTPEYGDQWAQLRVHDGDLLACKRCGASVYPSEGWTKLHTDWHDKQDARISSAGMWSNKYG